MVSGVHFSEADSGGSYVTCVKSVAVAWLCAHCFDKNFVFSVSSSLSASVLCVCSIFLLALLLAAWASASFFLLASAFLQCQCYCQVRKLFNPVYIETYKFLTGLTN